MKKFQVELMRVDTAYMTVEIEATSADAADGLIEDLLCEEGYPSGEEEAEAKLGGWEVHTGAVEVVPDAPMTNALAAAADMAGLEVRDVRLPSGDPNDMLGLPVVNKNED